MHLKATWIKRIPCPNKVKNVIDFLTWWEPIAVTLQCMQKHQQFPIQLRYKKLFKRSATCCQKHLYKHGRMALSNVDFVSNMLDQQFLRQLYNVQNYKAYTILNSINAEIMEITDSRIWMTCI